MVKLYFFFALMILSACSYGQLKATTEAGRKVILLDNGKWYYSDDSTAAVASGDSITINNSPFTRSKESAFLLKSKTLNVGIFLNLKDWNYQKPAKAQDNEYNFTFKKGSDIAGFLVTEKTEIPLESMVDIALINAQQTDPEATVVQKEYRNVNGVKVLCLQLTFTISKINFVLLGYYYTSDKGTVQLVSTTTAKLFDQERNSMEKFLNGFVVL